MIYEVLISFTDSKDSNHVYWRGDAYPRLGAKLDAKRLEHLQGDKNAFKTPVIGMEGVTPVSELQKDK